MSRGHTKTKSFQNRLNSTTIRVTFLEPHLITKISWNFWKFYFSFFFFVTHKLKFKYLHDTHIPYLYYHFCVIGKSLKSEKF